MEGKTHNAVVVLREANGSGVTGVLYFTQEEGGKVKVSGEVKGLKEGKHALHIHENGDLRGGGINVGLLYLTADLNSIEANSSGTAKPNQEDSTIQIIGPDSNIIGRSVAIYQSPVGETTGTPLSGNMAAVGVVGVSGPL